LEINLSYLRNLSIFQYFNKYCFLLHLYIRTANINIKMKKKEYLQCQLFSGQDNLPHTFCSEAKEKCNTKLLIYFGTRLQYFLKKTAFILTIY